MNTKEDLKKPSSFSLFPVAELLLHDSGINLAGNAMLRKDHPLPFPLFTYIQQYLPECCS